ncbi:MAG TPA: RluA family pseudouridine synthase [Terriglobales bacterium]|nr:RluA family pseudouridine synthase [Terriglobales bacterium]
MARPDPPATFPVAQEDAGLRLDQFVTRHLAGVSRARVQELIRQGKVEVNGAAAKASLKLHGGENVVVRGPAERPPLRAEPEAIPLDVVYEDDWLAVINKPAGMLVHAGAGRGRGTLVNALLYRFRSLSGVGGELRPGIVHRLDRQTSGLVVVAKDDATHRALAEQFSSRQVKKRYLALVHGWLKQDTGTVEAAIHRDRLRRRRMTTRRRGGREAVSRYKVLERMETPAGRFTQVEVEIATGRTHQIRVHMASLGHPVVGDTLYGAPRKLAGMPTLERNFLHAASLEFRHPKTGKPMALAAKLPEELEEFIGQLRPPANS